MMGWRGTLRSIRSIHNAQAKANARLQKYRAAAAQLDAKQQIQEQNIELVRAFEQRLEELKSMHTEGLATIDWQLIAQEPNVPKRVPTEQARAEGVLRTYKPSFFARLFGWDKRVISAYQKAVTAGIAKDQERFYDDQISYQNALDQAAFARTIIAGDMESILMAIEEINPFEELRWLGSELKLRAPNAGVIEVQLRLVGERLIPSASLALLKNGKVSEKKLSNATFNELYQDHACSALLRIARDVLAAVPVRLVIVHIEELRVNPVNGLQQAQVLVSAAVQPSRLAQINLATIDPSQAMQNFAHRMEWKKTTGFAGVTQITLQELA